MAEPEFATFAVATEPGGAEIFEPIRRHLDARSLGRQVANRGEEPVVFLAFGAAGDHVSRDAVAWGSWDEDGPGRSPAEVPLPPDFGD